MFASPLRDVAMSFQQSHIRLRTFALCDAFEPDLAGVAPLRLLPALHLALLPGSYHSAVVVFVRITSRRHAATTAVILSGRRCLDAGHTH